MQSRSARFQDSLGIQSAHDVSVRDSLGIQSAHDVSVRDSLGIQSAHDVSVRDSLGIQPGEIIKIIAEYLDYRSFGNLRLTSRRLRDLISHLVIPNYRRRLLERKENPLRFAVRHDSMPFLEYCHARESGDIEILKYALVRENLIAAQWLIEKGYSPDIEVLKHTLERGSLRSVQWLSDQLPDVEDNHFMVDSAAKNLHIEVLQWLLDRGCRGSPEASYSARSLDHLKLLVRYQNISYRFAMLGAVKVDKIKVVQWIYADSRHTEGLGNPTGNASERWLAGLMTRKNF